VDGVIQGMNSVVFITVGRWVDAEEGGCRFAREDGRGFIEEGYGLGFCFERPDIVVTCAHVVRHRDCCDVFLYAPGGVSRPQTVDRMWKTTNADLAVLLLQGESTLHPISARRDRKVRLGEETFFWSPLVLDGKDGTRSIDPCLRRTMVSRIFNAQLLDSGTPVPHKLFLDASIPPGSSGSPLVFGDGLLAGIVNAEHMRPSSEVSIPSGIGVAIPVHAVFAFVESLRSQLASLDKEA